MTLNLKRIPKLKAGLVRDPRTVARIVLGVLLAANIVAVVLVVWPIGGTPEQLERQLAGLRQQVQQRQTALQNIRALTAKVEKGRVEGDLFLDRYFLARRSAYSTLVGDLIKSAQSAGIRAKEHSFGFDEIEGSDTLAMMTITGNYEGSYADLIQFINAVDRSPRFLIVESLQAAPQQTGGTLNVVLRMNAFVRDDGSAPPPEPAKEAEPEAVATAQVKEPKL